jgi:hypothetical protein
VTSRIKRTLTVKVANTGQAVELMRILGELDADIIAESRPGVVKIRIYGSKDEIRDLARKILAVADAQQKNPKKFKLS